MVTMISTTRCCAILVISSTLVLPGCVSVPKESAILSAKISSQIAEAQRSNNRLLDEKIALNRRTVDMYLYHVWLPTYLIKMLEKADFDKKVCKKVGVWDQALVVRDFVDVVSKRIVSKRAEEMSPIEQEGREWRTALDNHYAQLGRMSRSLTANLQAVVKGQELEQQIRAALMEPIDDIIPVSKTLADTKELLGIDDDADVKKISGEGK